MGTVTVKLSNRPEGAKVEIPYLGLFDNGSTTEVDDKKLARYHKAYGGEGDVVVDSEQNKKDAEARSEAAKVDDLHDLKVPQLRSLADAQGIDLPAGAKKDDVVDALEGSHDSEEN
jgi:hypothetical protein